LETSGHAGITAELLVVSETHTVSGFWNVSN